MEIHTLTQLSYMTGSVKDIDNEKLAQFCISEGVRVSDDPLGSKFEDLRIPSNEEWNKVFANIQIQYMENFKSRLELTEHWSQIHKKYESTNMHNHHVPETLSRNDVGLSGVYYVQIPKNSGRLVFEYNINQFQNYLSWIEPVVGNFIIFPSTLNHYVTKNLGDECRVSISFNVINVPLKVFDTDEILPKPEK